LDRNSGDPVVRFWRAFAISCEGSHTEAIRELTPLQRSSEIALAVTACLIHTHKLAANQDKSELANLKENLKTLSKSSDDEALVFAARYFWHAGKAKNAKQCVEKVLGKNKKHLEGLCLFGWINLTSGNARNEKKSAQLFDNALKLDSSHCSSMMGRATFNEGRKSYDASISDFGEIVVKYPNFMPALTGKARVLMIQGDWEQSVMTAHRVLQEEPSDIEAMKIVTLFHLAREASDDGHTRVETLAAAIKRMEPSNANLFYQAAQMCARVSAKNPAILNNTIQMIEQACKLDSVNSAYLTEHAMQLLMLEEFSQASMYFDEASKLDEGNVQALVGRIKCKILSGQVTEAEQELEFLAEVNTSSNMGNTAELTMLSALLAWEKEQNQSKSVKLLNQACKEHFQMLETVSPGIPYYIAYNPEFIMEIVSELMKHVGTEPMAAGDPPNPLLKRSIQLLERLCSITPGILKCQLLLAKASFIQGDFEKSERSINKILQQLDNQCAQAHVIQAQICLAREQYKQCTNALEQARSLDFEVRNTPVYHLVKARVLDASGQTDEALKLLESAMSSIPGVKTENKMHPLPLAERISLFLELASVHTKLNQVPEATKIMNDAKNTFGKSGELVRIIIADAELAVKRRDFNAGLAMLNNVPKDSIYYIRAKMAMANIHLRYKKDRQAYARCYLELARANKNTHSLVLLGEAYMRIQQPAKAIKAYQDALAMDPTDPKLASKIGRALISTHDYAKAVQYYETAAQGDPSKVYLSQELAALYIQLTQFDEAIRVLNSALITNAEKADPEDISTMQSDVRSHSLLADVYQGAGKPDLTRDSLTEAWNLQTAVLSRLGTSNPDSKRKEDGIAADLCYRLAEHHKKDRQMDKAQQFYYGALKYDENHEPSRLALAKYYMQKNDLDACQQQCVTLMRIDPSSTEGKQASMMLADLMFRKNEPDAAIFHFQQLLEKNPTRYAGLDKLIQLLRRAGRLKDIPKFIKTAEKHSAKASFAPGLHYCKGLYAWYQNNPTEALAAFNSCRKDGEFGKKALVNMIDIYLNPDTAALFQDATEADGDHTDYLESAYQLLKELKAQGGDEKMIAVMESYCLMASKNKGRIEKALELLKSILSDRENKDYIPAKLALANAFLLLGGRQDAKGKTQLKYITKMPMSPEFSMEIEKACLLLADIYIAAGKMDLATELCTKCITNNKSCAKGWEMIGMIHEKEQAYRDARSKSACPVACFAVLFHCSLFCCLHQLFA